MNHSLFLQIYQHLQYGIMYNRLIDLDFASIAWCKKYDSPFFNHAQINRVITNTELKTIEDELNNLGRKPAIYFENRENLKSLVEFLLDHQYKKSWGDSWMFHSGKDIDASRFSTVTKVSNEKELQMLLNTFDLCYQKDDPQNPYGELGDYLEVARDSWHRHSGSGKIEYFIVFKDNTPAAVSTLTNFAGIGYIPNVGSLRQFRGEGFGKVASLFCVRKSIANGNKIHTLATEEGQYPNDFYQRIGFKTEFTAVGYTV